MFNYKIQFLLFSLIIACGITSCRDTYTPKPPAYFRIDYPEHAYQHYDSSCNFVFDYPIYATLEDDKDRNSEPCWFNIVYTPFDARLHLSYKRVENLEHFFILTKDSRELVYKHTVKADAIRENLILTDQEGVSGKLYELDGSTATALQFFVTDSLQHFLRGSLYFNSQINRDSMDPIIDFLTVDIKHMINSLEWK
ncbi:MAG: gliding motility lipoprotein GldD [Bacteroidetes bacterium]|jgi:gliding motility-associated lipoprotein GldD|nr:gliding motility lipoprotein GldD [Bacteroidota bacterium]MBT7040596.1 gliding motility lipoprotein GldD [Bacteroidota bacterium]